MRVGVDVGTTREDGERLYGSAGNVQLAVDRGSAGVAFPKFLFATRWSERTLVSTVVLCGLLLID